MKPLIKILLICIGFTYAGVCQERIQINIPTADAESDYIWNTLQNMPFFERNNYQISLPKGALIESLKDKSRSNNLTEEDRTNLKNFVRDSVYNKSDYQKGYEKIKNELTLINKMVRKVLRSKRNWSFKEFDVYQIDLTLYGPGGGYNPDEGIVLIYTTPNGGFKLYDNPANTIIHEIVHIGIEESIITNFKVPHQLKERIVDNIVSLTFKKYLPDYRIQDMGDKRIDPYLKKKKDIRNLNKFVAEIMSKT